MQLLPAPGNVLPKGSIKFNLGPSPSYPATADAQKQAPIAAPGGKDRKNQAPQLNKGTRQNQ